MCQDNRSQDKVYCPKCGAKIENSTDQYKCHNKNCGLFFPRIIRRKVISLKVLKDLIENKETEFIQGFYKKGLNQTFTAYLKLSDDWRVSIHLHKISSEFCPLCNKKLYIFYKGFECLNNECKVGKIWNTFRDRILDSRQILKLIRNGRTDLIKGFLSIKNGKRYSGYIVLGNDGKVGIEFEDSDNESNI